MSMILLVDDDKDMLSLSQRWLVKAGYDTITAVSGGEALEAMRTSKPDLVILDMYMPDMNGSEVYNSMKADDSLGSIPVIIRTGNEETVDLPVTVVAKSAGKLVLLDAVRRILQ